MSSNPVSTLEYRKSRISSICNTWGLEKINSLIAAYKISNDDFKDLKFSIKLYISKALHFDYSDSDEDFLNNLNLNKDNRKNVTPNGGISPKEEYSLHYNIVLKTWSDIVTKMIKNDSRMLKKFRLTPNIRVKYGDELKDNANRALNTAHPHSDAWLEGPFGLNCHIPILGDTSRNFLQYYELIDESQYKDDFLALSESYTDMQWVEKYYKINHDFIPQPGVIYLSDYALLHKTFRSEGCSDRISIDTTMFVGDHDVFESRSLEYSDEIPKVGNNFYCKCTKSENDPIVDKSSTFSHYAIENLKYLEI